MCECWELNRSKNIKVKSPRVLTRNWSKYTSIVSFRQHIFSDFIISTPLSMQFQLNRTSINNEPRISLTDLPHLQSWVIELLSESLRASLYKHSPPATSGLQIAYTYYNQLLTEGLTKQPQLFLPWSADLNLWVEKEKIEWNKYHHRSARCELETSGQSIISNK